MPLPQQQVPFPHQPRRQPHPIQPRPPQQRAAQERVVFPALFKMNFEPYFELDISIYFTMTMIWSPGNSQKRKQDVFYI